MYNIYPMDCSAGARSKSKTTDLLARLCWPIDIMTKQAGKQIFRFEKKIKNKWKN